MQRKADLMYASVVGGDNLYRQLETSVFDHNNNLR